MISSLATEESGSGVPPLIFDRALPDKLEEYEEALIRQAMIEARGVQAAAARLLGISRSNLQYKLRKLGLMND